MHAHQAEDGVAAESGQIPGHREVDELVVEGSEEPGTGGLEEYVPPHVGELRADAMPICATGNAAAGVPTVTTSLCGVVGVVVGVAALRAGARTCKARLTPAEG